MEQSVEALSAIPARMCAAWGRGDAAGFYADFAEDAELVEFEGSILRGRATMVAANQQVFDTVMKGSQLVRSEVPFARVVAPGYGVVHHRAGILLPGEEEPLSSRYVMQLLAVVWQNDRWEVATLQNARIVSFEATMALDRLAAGA
ncbi:uncharacterized protein (TIGR02246 family) [Catenuloplanes nepalensis]|uniref:Uncharacterized protein (TIGR02246 family) n=1 Tax=Catenuloplanes nepalensis TaxID=587533 RepID=A0ABT9MTQ7_9ACTN|nr:SgcJ/EcaC family oxidoreductase [Catenuloplanes nepalensis]MDP9794827.1 uncharacterized protein (TIGR02246 family) [Catenuloplanes nepalensis]